MERAASGVISDQASNTSEISRIAQGAKIVGEISSRTDMFIDGSVDGKVYSQGTVIVGPQAVLKGSLVCNDVELIGRMDGDIYVKGVLSIKSNAVVNGNIHVCKLEVEMGGQLNGSCQMITDDEFDKLRGSVITMEAPVPAAPKKSNPIKFQSSTQAKEENAASIAATNAVNAASMKPSAVKKPAE